MTWTKLGDEFLDAAYDLSDMAFRLHVEALMYSNRRLLDLVVPKREVRRFTGSDDLDAAVSELVESGWWQDAGDSWWIGCRFAHWQQDRVQVENKRKGWAERQRRQRRHRLDDHSLCIDCGQKDQSDSDSRGESSRDSRRDPVSVSETVSGLEEARTEGSKAHAHEDVFSPGRPASHVTGDSRRDACDAGCVGVETRVNSAGARLCERCAPHLFAAAS